MHFIHADITNELHPNCLLVVLRNIQLICEKLQFGAINFRRLCKKLENLLEKGSY
jgi:hypothetical protein